jgi:hypothetical protein
MPTLRANTVVQGTLCFVNRRFRTLLFGAIPLFTLLALINLDRIPGTDIDLYVPYAAEGPGPTFNTLDSIDGVEVVQISGVKVDKTAGNLNMTTVSVRTQMTLMQAASRWLFTDDTIVPIEQVIPQDRSEEEVQKINEQAFLSSESSATTAALRYLKKPLEVEVVEVVEDSPAAQLLKKEDKIIKIDGVAVESGGHAQELVRKHKVGDQLELVIARNDAEITETVELAQHPQDRNLPFLGINMSTVPAGDIEVKYNLEDIGGPSAGMMFALAVVDKLSPGELNGGKFVAGTGTIEDDGSVGAIGGITHKAKAAAENGAELFLVPAGNCGEMRSASFDTMSIAKVDNLTDAVEAMDNFAKGKPVEGCN